MPEVPASGEGHRHATLVRSGDDFVVALGAAWLYRRGRTGLGSGDKTVGEREESITANGAAVQVEPGLASLPDGDTTGIDAAHLTRTNAKGAIFGGINDGVRLDELDGSPAKEHRLEFILAGLAPGNDLEIDSGGLPEIAFLHKERLGTH